MAHMNLRGRPPHLRTSNQQSQDSSDWVEYEQHYLRVYREATYYSSGRGWPDYAPAYRYGYDNYGRFRGRHFEEVEALLERSWAAGRGESRLAWVEARGAVRDIWQRLDLDVPGERDKVADRRQ